MTCSRQPVLERCQGLYKAPAHPGPHRGTWGVRHHTVAHSWNKRAMICLWRRSCCQSPRCCCWCLTIAWPSKNGPIEPEKKTWLGRSSQLPRTKCWKGSSFLVAAGTKWWGHGVKEVNPRDRWILYVDRHGWWSWWSENSPAIYAKGQGIGFHNVS